jgi:hypothetical protein
VSQRPQDLGQPSMGNWVRKLIGKGRPQGCANWHVTALLSAALPPDLRKAYEAVKKSARPFVAALYERRRPWF